MSKTNEQLQKEIDELRKENSSLKKRLREHESVIKVGGGYVLAYSDGDVDSLFLRVDEERDLLFSVDGTAINLCITNCYFPAFKEAVEKVAPLMEGE
jgi:DNA-binding protein YbaB